MNFLSKLLMIEFFFHLVKLQDGDRCEGVLQNNITNALRQLEGLWIGGGVFNLERPDVSFTIHPNLYIPLDF